jgi:chondroitin AC lyase
MNPKYSILPIKRLFWSLAFVIYLLSFLPLLAENPKDITTIKKRIVIELLGNEINPEEIEKLLTTQKEDGTWPGINYEDVSRTAFEHRIHTGNMVTLSRAYSKIGSKYSQNRKVLKAIEEALSHWVKEDYFCENWWHNQIGTPNSLVTVMLLVGSELPKELTGKAQPMIGRAHLEASGARPSGDRIKIAGILAKNLLFVEDYQQFDEVIKVIEAEIKFSSERGMQYDYSFHHRVDRVNNTLSYGLGYADAFVEWAVFVAGTEYAFTEEKTRHLVDYYLDGICKSMPFMKYPDTGAKNRGIARPGALKPMNSHPQKLLQATDYRKEELKEVIRNRDGEVENFNQSHSTFFWHSEHFTVQRPDFYTSVRMYSSRNYNMEVPYNSEGLKNHHRGDGTNHLNVTGEEYYDIFPVMDYQKIPGTTTMQKDVLPSENEIQKLGTTDFVGAVTDGKYGAAAFDFRSPHDPLEAKKSWFFFDKEYVCLGAGINAGSNNPVATTLSQNLLLGKVTVGSKDGAKKLSSGEHQLKEVSWVHSDQVAYIFPEPQAVNLFNGSVKGNWRDISKQSSTPKEDVTKDIFKLWIDHGSRPKGEAYAYIVVPAVDQNQAASFDLKSTLQILSNTPEIQAVKHHQLGIYQLVFYKSGELDLGDGLIIYMDSPGQIMLQVTDNEIKKITVADPSRKLGKIHFSITARLDNNGENITSKWNESRRMSEVAIELHKDVYAGKSVIVEF